MNFFKEHKVKLYFLSLLLLLFLYIYFQHNQYFAFIFLFGIFVTALFMFVGNILYKKALAFLYSIIAIFAVLVSLANGFNFKISSIEEILWIVFLMTAILGSIVTAVGIFREKNWGFISGITTNIILFVTGLSFVIFGHCNACDVIGIVFLFVVLPILGLALIATPILYTLRKRNTETKSF